MSKDEVKGLASLASANGMRLTVNPETGLPEAFKLGKVLQAALPIAAGFALGPAGFGLMSSGMAGLTVGGLYGLATGSVEKGLMAGLGAWGGAGLGGTSAATSAAPGTTGALTGPAATTVSTPTAASITSPLTSSATVAPTAFAAQPTVAGLTSVPSAGLGTGYGAVNTGIGSIAAPTVTAAAPAAAPGIGSSIAGFAKANPWTTAALVGGPLLAGMEQKTPAAVETDKGMIRPYTFAREVNRDAFTPPASGSTAERNYFASQRYTPLPAYEAAEGGQVPRYEQMAPGGLASIEGMRDGYGAPQTIDGNIPQYAAGGLSSLGGYSDGGRLLKGPGDGVSDSIPATINNKQPAKLADGEFVVPARIVSEIGNGSTDAGARKLYAMMDRVQNRRKKTVGKGKVAVNTKAEKDLPA
jgi:hypothetical protein